MGDPNNVLLCTDSYKVSHHLQYPEGTSFVYSYFESRGGKFPTVTFFGLQYILKRYLQGQVVTEEKIQEAKEIYRLHFNNENIFNEEGWRYILQKHKGHLPLRIKAVPEGTTVPCKNVLFTVENTDPYVPWVTNWFETMLVQTWYPCTVVTNSRAMKEIIAEFLVKTADNIAGLPFKLHDFGFRGVSSIESASLGGLSHLVNFQGTDTIAGLVTARKYYSCEMPGFSIPAAEHSTITTWGKNHEKEAFANMLAKFPRGLVAVVSDSFDIYNACQNVWGTELRDMVIERGKSKSCLVIRPDSGDPAEVVVKVLEILGNCFGTTVNSKGYKMLPPYLRVIQGDGIGYDTLRGILTDIADSGWSTDNLTFGCGGALLQKVHRDTQKFAFKCSYCVIGGHGKDVYKSPITDPGKNSKKGKLMLEKENGTYVTRQGGTGTPEKDLLVPVFENGRILQEYTLDEIRERAELDIVREASKNLENGTREPESSDDKS